MKKLIISMKSGNEALEQFADALIKARRKNGAVEPHYEIAFDNRKDFNKFVRNIYVLEAIQALRPDSVYDLAKKIDIDHSNLNKVILFFEEIGAVKIKERTRRGKTLKTPSVEYDVIQFNLNAA